MFTDRKDGGRALARELEAYRGKADIVLAIPRGGVRIGIEAATALDCDLSLIVSRKLPFPDSPEAGFGAVAEDGSIYLIPGARDSLPPQTIQSVIREQERVIEKRIRILREGRPLPEIRGKGVIVVDDGIAMGSTMLAAVKLCRNMGAGSVIVASPVAGPRTLEAVRKQADEMVVLESPPMFRAVAQVYRKWTDVTDTEVIDMMKSFRKTD